jgi:methyl-accepting chemotaxis protein
VVAAEVRQLAQRTAVSAQEIEQLVKSSVTQAKEGTLLVDGTMKKLTEIVKAVTTVSDIMGEIATANQEQAKSIHYVNQAIVHIDDMTQQNTNLVKEIASASESMYIEAINLEQQVKFFKLEGIEIA